MAITLKTAGDMQNFYSKLAKAGLITTHAREKPEAKKLNQPPLENVAAPVTGFNEPKVETSETAPGSVEEPPKTVQVHSLWIASQTEYVFENVYVHAYECLLK